MPAPPDAERRPHKGTGATDSLDTKRDDRESTAGVREVSERLRVLHQIRAATAEDVRRQVATMVLEDWPPRQAAEAVVRWWVSEVAFSAAEAAVTALHDHLEVVP
jgi:hypothetical protein